MSIFLMGGVNMELHCHLLCCTTTSPCIWKVCTVLPRSCGMASATSIAVAPRLHVNIVDGQVLCHCTLCCHLLLHLESCSKNKNHLQKTKILNLNKLVILLIRMLLLLLHCSFILPQIHKIRSTSFQDVFLCH